MLVMGLGKKDLQTLQRAADVAEAQMTLVRLRSGSPGRWSGRALTGPLLVVAATSLLLALSVVALIPDDKQAPASYLSQLPEFSSPRG